MKLTKENVSSLFYDWRRNVIGSVDELHKRIIGLDDTLEKVVVPKYVAEWIEWNKESGVSLQIILKCYEHFYDNRNPNCQTDGEKAVQWYVDNPYKFIQAYVNGYTIKKEQLYEVVIHETEDDRLLLVTNESGYKFELESVNEGFWKQSHAEPEIKKIDARYWTFAVPAEETE